MKDKYNEPLQGSANDIFGAFHNNRDDDNYNGSNGLPQSPLLRHLMVLMVLDRHAIVRHPLQIIQKTVIQIMT